MQENYFLTVVRIKMYYLGTSERSKIILIQVSTVDMAKLSKIILTQHVELTWHKKLLLHIEF